VRAIVAATGAVANNARVALALDGKPSQVKCAVPGTYVVTDPESSTTLAVEAGGPLELETMLDGSLVVIAVAEGGSATIVEGTDGSGAVTDLTVTDVAGDVTVNGEPMEPGGAPIRIASLDAKVTVRRGQLTLVGTLRPGASTGAAPGTDDVTLKIGDTTFLIEGGLASGRGGSFTFAGVVPSAPGVQLTLALKPARASGEWTVKATASPMSGLVNPVAVSLRIGDVSAATQVTATLR
jgi:hypothetical protein